MLSFFPCINSTILFQELLFETKTEKMEKSYLEIFCIRMKQLSINVLIICALIGVGYLTWFFLDRAFKESFSPIWTAVFVNVMMAVIPVGLSWIVK